MGGTKQQGLDRWSSGVGLRSGRQRENLQRGRGGLIETVSEWK